MNFKEAGFRAFYHNLVAIKATDFLKQKLEGYPDADQANYVLVYGYIDSKKGLMLEILAGGKKGTKYFRFFDPARKRSNISVKEVEDAELFFFDDEDGRLHERYAAKLNTLEKKYAVSEDLEKTRMFGFLDTCREQAFPDDVRVVFLKNGCKPEECWVRITGLGDHVIQGILLNKPYQDFGIKKGEPLSFQTEEQEDKSVICVAHFAGDSFTRKDLEDGTVLKGAVAEFEKEHTEENYHFVLMILRSSTVLVPCDVELSKEAEEILDRLKKEGKDRSRMTDEESRKLQAGMRFHPHILTNQGEEFVGIYSGKEDLEKSQKEGSIVSMPFLHAIQMAREEGENIRGIVLNAFTDPFVVERDLFEAMEQMEPLFEEAEEEEEVLAAAPEAPMTFASDDATLAIDVGKMDVFNFALYQNSVPPIRGIRILNRSGDPVQGLVLKISADYDFFSPFEIPLPPIPFGKPVSLPDPKLAINGSKLAGMTETVETELTVELLRDGQTVCGCRGRMKVLAYDQWQGGDSYVDLLPAFVLPNHPAVPALLHDAAERLKKWGKPASLEGYQMRDPNRVRDLAAAAYAAIQKKNIVYAEPPASFSVAGQRIRTPETILEQRLGTCMDMTLLYAACLEAMGLHPLLVLMQGHIFAGVWLKERSIEELRAGTLLIENPEELTMRFGSGTDEMTFIECTAMCAGKNTSFETAEMVAKKLNLADTDNFRCGIDVRLARAHGIRPIASRVRDGSAYEINTQEMAEQDITAAPSDLGITIADMSDVSGSREYTKRDLWESKLLDISRRNMLLNLPHNASVVPIMSSHIDELEDALADGHEFHLLPAADWIAQLSYSRVQEDGTQSEPIRWLPEALRERGVFEITEWPASKDFDFNEKFRQEFRNHRLYTFSTPKQLERELTTIYRAARASQQENGVSSLYLAIGLLRWFGADEGEKEETVNYAPLILLPIEIIRKSANQGYGLHARDEEPHFNTTLLEMLQQKYNIRIGGLDPLPTDAHGIDIKKIFAMVRSALYTLKNWDVVESCVIGNFSFAQFAMWNDLHTAGGMLEGSKVVRSLMKGHVDWDTRVSEEEEGEKTYLPITVDATQLQAIKMAAHGTTFVLHGPPGTGKSQTITGMIANLMAQGKTVLFVAEKMAALSVVQRRLAALGLDDFCLELHSDKANKKHVLSQLSKVLAIKKPQQNTEYEDYLKNTAESRSRLDGYAGRLHAVHHSGHSLHQLIDLYETVRDTDRVIRFTDKDAAPITREDMKRHPSLISQLTAAGSVIPERNREILSGIGLQSYSADVRMSLRRTAEAYQSILDKVRICGEKTAEILGQERPVSRMQYSELHDLLTAYFAWKETMERNPALAGVLIDGSEELSVYYNRLQDLTLEDERQQKIWKTEFLGMNMQTFRTKHESAGRKFFGRASAMTSITAEIQKYAKVQITYDLIPDLLREVEKLQGEIREWENYTAKLPMALKQITEQYRTRQAYEDALTKLRRQADVFPGGLDALRSLSEEEKTDRIFTEFEDTFKNYAEVQTAFDSLLVRNEEEIRERTLSEEADLCLFLMDDPAALKDWGLYNQIREKCLKAGLRPVVHEYETTRDTTDLVNAYRKGLYRALINEIIAEDDVLSSFSGVTFNEAIQQFKNMDDSLLRESKEEIRHLLASRIPSDWDGPEISKELNLLRKAIGSNARGMSIRALFERIPHLIGRLCPCMLMSPNSVAQYLEQRNDLFDVVIFDEASQLPTCKAVGALARAKNAVIVGDPKQMPPTSFFAGSGPNVEDLALDDLDSILDDALALGIPAWHLQWHYRSTHESLIAFSNSEFYGNKMFTFPSAFDRERHVTVIHVDGQYKNGTNMTEAEAIVAEVIRRYHDPALRGQSIGIVSFNVKQQALIENLLARQFQNDAALDAWANSGEDPLFVKNLENVQGDERDVILFSIGYGPDEKGRISMNFGPINQTGGGKRLNVAFSRARITMTVFSSLHSTDIKVTENSPEGLVAFRDFLRFAEGHELQNAAAAFEQDQQSHAGILKTICDAITAQGYQCETMVGHSDFHLDIAVIDPFDPARYLLGILLDGEGYRKTTNTRDREVAQSAVLRSRGWKLLRVWTIDWWDNRNRVLKRILSVLSEQKAEAEERNQERIAARKAQEAEADQRQLREQRLKEELARQASEVLAEEADAEKEEQSPVTVQPEGKPAVQVEEQPAAQVEENADSKPAEEETAEIEEKTIESLLASLQTQGAQIVDKRANGGALWVVGGWDLSALMKEFRALGIHFTYKAGGGKATEGKDGWWAKTDIELPEFQKAEQGETTEQEAQETTPETPETAPAAEWTLTDYEAAVLEETKISASELASPDYRTELCTRITALLEVEAPILKDVLIRRVIASCGTVRNAATTEAVEKAIKFLKVKTAKQKGIAVCWSAGQDPKDYREIRVSSSRPANEICLQEISNAACYVLKQKKDLSEAELIKEISLLFGYKRLGKNVEEAMAAGIQYARSSKAVTAKKDHYRLTGEPEEPQSTQAEQPVADVVFYTKTQNGADAKGMLTKDGFKVLRGSKISVAMTDSFQTASNNYYNLRLRLIEEGVIKNNRFARNYEFSSPSAASSVIRGNNSNGNNDWRTEEGVRLKDYLG